MEKEFNLKEFFFYCARRWFYFLVAVVICAVAAAALTGFMKKEFVTYQATATVCDIETYAGVFGWEPYIIEPGYRENSARATDAMADSGNIFLFLQHNENKELLRSGLAGASAQDNELKLFLEQNLTVGRTSYRVTVSLKYDRYGQKSWTESEVKKLLDAYTGFIISEAYGKVERFGEMKDLGAAAVTPAAAQLTDRYTEEASAFRNTAVGVAAGFMAALLVVSVLYFADPRLKSADEAARFGFPVLVSLPDAEFTKDGLAALSIRLDRSKRICVLEPDGGEIGNFCKNFAGVLSGAGYKTLFVDGKSGGGKFKEYLWGAKLSDCVQSTDGVETLGFSGPGDAAYLLPKKERFLELDKAYDKIIFACDAGNAGAVAACSSVCDAAVCILDKTAAKVKNVRRAAGELSDTVVNACSLIYSAAL